MEIGADAMEKSMAVERKKRKERGRKGGRKKDWLNIELAYDPEIPFLGN